MSEITMTKGNPLLSGAVKTEHGINFSVAAPTAESCSLILYKKGTTDIICELPFGKNERFGGVFAGLVKGVSPQDIDYNFCVDGHILTDPYASVINNHGAWGAKAKDLTCGIADHNAYDWKGDESPDIDFSDNIIYRLHVRGFTMADGSGARHKGTYKGVSEKIPYLKELGINMVEFMPAYDFYETPPCAEDDDNLSRMRYMHTLDGRVNFWGYTKAAYFAPKASFSAASDGFGAVKEFKDMVADFHKNGIEVCMEFYFGEDEPPVFIVDSLKNWVINYHIDAIHLNCGAGAMEAALKDSVLSRTKLFGYGFDERSDAVNRDARGANVRKRLGMFNDDFMITARKFLKGDENMTEAMAFKTRFNPAHAAVVNYIANHGTFTLMDTVTYNRRHNEANGEGGRDGAEYNYSWNCGEEGATRRKKVADLRKKQIKNALSFVLLSQGVPMIYAGDERGNSNMGNNNPYCQDNEISWLSWEKTKSAKEIFNYTRFLIEFRKRHGVLHMPDGFRLTDYKSLGYPDVSYHGAEAWHADFDYVSRQFSVMYCGKYAGERCNILIAYNMYWEAAEFGIPAPAKGCSWRVAFATDKSVNIDDEPGRVYTVPGRTVAALIME